jgi:hypothetical protein
VALRNKVVLRTVGYTLAAVAVLTFAAYVVLKVQAGQSADTYYSGTMKRWNYGAALAGLVALAVAAAVAWIARFASWFRTNREIRRLAKDRSTVGANNGHLESTSPNTSLERTRER